jgi:hypothetical protein
VQVRHEASTKSFVEIRRPEGPGDLSVGANTAHFSMKSMHEGLRINDRGTVE